MSERGHFRGGPSNRGGRGGGHYRGGGSGGEGGGGFTRGGGNSTGRGRGGGGLSSGRGGGHQHGASGGGGGGSGSTATGNAGGEKAKKENILDLAKYLDKEIRVKFGGGREVIGTLKGYDQLMNLVLDDVKELLRDDEGNESSRQLGLLVARGTLLVLVSPVDGSEEIANPFTAADD